VDISAVKTTVMTFQRRDSILSKICFYNKFIEQVNCFICLSYCITYWNKTSQHSNGDNKPSAQTLVQIHIRIKIE